MANPKHASAFAEWPVAQAAKTSIRSFPGFMERCLPVKTFKKGGWIFTQGDVLDGLYVVQEGRVLLTRLSASGRETIIDMIGPGEFFGDVSLLDGEIASFNALAVQSTVLLVVRKPEFRTMLGNPSACRYLVDVLARRCNDAWTQIEILGNSLLEEKVRIMLTWLAKKIGIATPEGVCIRMSQGQLAKIVGSSRESLNRQLGILKDEGTIRIKGKYPQISLLIVAPHRLCPAG